MKKEKPTEKQKRCEMCMSKKDLPKEYWSDNIIYTAILISPLSPLGHRIRVERFDPEIQLNILEKRLKFRFIKEIPDFGGVLHSLYYFDNKEVLERCYKQAEYKLYEIY